MLRCAALVVLGALVMPDVCAAEWIEVRTANFRFIGDAPERDVREIARKLEQFRDVLRHVTPGLTPTSPVPTIVLVFSGTSAFAPYRPLRDGRPVPSVAAYFQAGDTVNYIAMVATGGAAAIRLVFHEYTHFLTANGLGDTPAWFAEGMAQLYETTQIRDDGGAAVVGAPIVPHLNMLAQRAMLPLDRLMGVADTLSMLHAGGSSNVFYAQSWALMHYLLLGNPGRTEQLRAYVEWLRRGETPAAAFEAAFGTDVREIEQELAVYVRQLRFTGRFYPFDDLVTGGEIPPGQRLADADAEAYLADLLARTDREAEARVRLVRLLDTNPAHAHAAAILGWLELRADDMDRALPLLERAAAAAPDDGAILAALGMALYDAARRDSSSRAALESTLARAHTVLTRALAADRRMAPALVALANVETTIGDLGRARDLIDEAVAAAPSRLEYRLVLAEVLVRMGDRERARMELESLAGRSADLPTTKAARDLLAHLDGDTPGSGGGLVAASRPALRLVREGERRVIGRFVGMDCSGRVTQFHVETETGLLRFDEVLGGVQIIAFRPAPSAMGCGPVQDPPRVLATYRPIAGRTKPDGTPDPVDGAIVAIEIVPDEFEP